MLVDYKLRCDYGILMPVLLCMISTQRSIFDANAIGLSGISAATTKGDQFWGRARTDRWGPAAVKLKDHPVWSSAE